MAIVKSAARDALGVATAFTNGNDSEEDGTMEDEEDDEEEEEEESEEYSMPAAP